MYDNKLTIKGPGSLTIGSESNRPNVGIQAYGDVTITENAIVSIYDNNDGILAFGDVLINNGAEVFVDDLGLLGDPSNCQQQFGGCAIHAGSTDASPSSITIENSTVLATSSNAYGIYATEKIIVSNSDLTVYAPQKSAFLAEEVEINNATAHVAEGQFNADNIATYKQITFTKGATSSTLSVSYGGGYTLYKTISSDLESISKVYVDGKEVDAKYYTIWGSNVTLNEAFLKTLSAGEHSIKLTNDTLQATGTFKLEASELTAAGVTTSSSSVGSPKTADAGIALYAGLAISSVLGMGYLKKKEF